MCEQFEVSRSGYYAWLDREPSQHAADDLRLGAMVREVHVDHRRAYGSPRVYAELKEAGQRVSCKRVARLMRQQGLVARTRRRFRRTTDSNHDLPVAPNLLARAFFAETLNEVWVTDITYLWTREGWLYLSALIDLCSRRVVGWAMGENIDTQLCLRALEMAIRGRHPPVDLIHHSDRGSQYASLEYQATLKLHGMRCSMSKKGDCWDNAVAESFWSTIKTELIEGTDFATRADARRAVFEYIEGFYNQQRRHSTLGYVSPAAFEASR